MEIFLFITLVFIYMLTAWTVPIRIVRRIWISGYVLSCLLTSLSVILIGAGGQTVLMRENELNWYFILYLFGSVSVIFGLINLWIYRRDLWNLFRRQDPVSEDQK